jgi:NADH-quinone oxidoreductase subunit N
VLEANGVGQKITDLAGLSKRSPFLAGCLAVFILSLAGIPPLAGFFGKFAVFAGALQLGGLSGPAGWLTALAILLSAVALYYYLLVLKQALVAKALPTDAPQSVGKTPSGQQPATVPRTTLCVPLITKLTLGAAAAAIIVLGLFPTLLLGLF